MTQPFDKLTEAEQHAVEWEAGRAHKDAIAQGNHDRKLDDFKQIFASNPVIVADAVKAYGDWLKLEDKFRVGCKPGPSIQDSM